MPRNPVEVLSTWDGTHYAHIAAHGYSAQGEERRRFVFFPLLPLLARLLGGAEGAPLAGLILNQLCLLGSVVLLGELAGAPQPAALHRHPGFWLLVSPFAFFFSVFYAESLLLFLTLGMFREYRRGRFSAAALCGLLAGLTRPSAIVLPALFALEVARHVRQRKRWGAALVTAVTPWIGLGLFLGFVAYLTRDPLGYVHIRRQFWAHQWNVPFTPLIRSARLLLHDLAGGHGPPAALFAPFISTGGIVALAAWGWKRLEPSLFLYLAVSMLFIHSQPHVGSGRFELLVFPAYLLLSQVFSARPLVAGAVVGLLILLQGVLFLQHATWRWVA